MDLKLKKNRVDRRAQDIFGQTTFIIVILDIQQAIENKANLPLEKVSKLPSASLNTKVECRELI